MSFLDLSSLLRDQVSKKGFGRQIEAARIVRKCGDIVSALLPESARPRVLPLYVRDRIVTIRVPAPVVAQELKMKEQEIVAGVNRSLGYPAIVAVRFVT